MFVDASALCAIMAAESDAVPLASRIEGTSETVTSAMAVWETAVAISRILRISPTEAADFVSDVAARLGVVVVAIPPEAAELAIQAFERFGKGRHPAALNFGDCFAYACARHFRLPLLFKGGDFSRTDIEAA